VNALLTIVVSYVYTRYSAVYVWYSS